MKQTAQMGKDPQVRRFAQMVLRHYAFPVLVGVVEAKTIHLLKHFNLNDMLSRMVRKKNTGWLPLFHTLPWLFIPATDAFTWAQQRRRILDLGMDMDGMENAYLIFLWQTARRHRSFATLRRPPRIKQGQATQYRSNR